MCKCFQQAEETGEKGSTKSLNIVTVSMAELIEPCLSVCMNIEIPATIKARDTKLVTRVSIYNSKIKYILI